MTFQKGNTLGRLNKGHKLSEELKRNLSESRKDKSYEVRYGALKAREIKQRISDALKTAYAEGRRNRVFSEEHKKKISLSRIGNKYRLGKKHSEESRKKMSLSHTGQIAWNKGKHWSKEFRERHREIIKQVWKNPEYREREILTHKGKVLSNNIKEKISNSLKNKPKSEETKRNMSLARKGKKFSDSHRLNLIKAFQSKEHKEKRSKISKELWKKEGYKEKTIRAQLNLINKHNLPFKYVGNGQILICYRNPDFIECNGKKLLIETYFSLWHSKDYEEQRNKIFSKYGYKTLFLNENDLESKDWNNICLGKINNFLENNKC